MKQLTLTLAIILLSVISGCATLSGRDAPTVRVAGLSVLPSEGLELRLALKLRVQNPNEIPLAYSGLSVKLDLDGRGIASGVSNESGEIARFSDQVLTVPVSISAFAAFRQLLAGVREGRADSFTQGKAISYSLSGKLGAGAGQTGATRFSDTGSLDLFSNEQDR